MFGIKKTKTKCKLECENVVSKCPISVQIT